MEMEKIHNSQAQKNLWSDGGTVEDTDTIQ